MHIVLAGDGLENVMGEVAHVAVAIDRRSLGRCPAVRRAPPSVDVCPVLRDESHIVDIKGGGRTNPAGRGSRLIKQPVLKQDKKQEHQSVPKREFQGITSHAMLPRATPERERAKSERGENPKDISQSNSLLPAG